MSWIEFNFDGLSKSGKTKEWRVQPCSRVIPDACLGIVKWYAPWRKYAFEPNNYTVLEEDCLRGIALFCEQQTREHKSRLMEAKETLP